LAASCLPTARRTFTKSSWLRLHGKPRQLAQCTT
jgi:hypothetical protein